MGGIARMQRKEMDKFVQYWEDLFEEFPEARRRASAAMGEAAKKHLDRQIGRSGFRGGADYTVRSWQELRLGSEGGYAAISPTKGIELHQPAGRRGPKTWRGGKVTSSMVTRWQERGYGTRQPAPGSSRAWSRVKNGNVHVRDKKDYVKAKQFYSFTKLRAFDIALKAAGQVMERIAWSDEYMAHLKQEFDLE